MLVSRQLLFKSRVVWTNNVKEVSFSMRTSASLAVNEELFITNRKSAEIRFQELDENGQRFLQESKSLQRSSTDPRHLTILHESKNKQLAEILYQRLNTQEYDQRLFFHFGAGFGQITRYVIEMTKSKRSTDTMNDHFIMFERYSDFQRHLRDIVKSHHAPLDSHKGLHVELLRNSPYEFKTERNVSSQRFFEIAESMKELEGVKRNIVVFGIVPWNQKAYMSLLFSQFMSSFGTFKIPADNVEYYLYLNEYSLARLQARTVKKYAPFANSPVSTLACLFSKVDVIEEIPCEYFFPYPLISSPHKQKNKYPNRLISYSKMFLVRIKFHDKSNSLLAPGASKRLFALFLSQLFIRPTQPLNKSTLKGSGLNLDQVLKDGQLALNKYQPVNQIEPIKLVMLFNYLWEHKQAEITSKWVDPG